MEDEDGGLAAVVAAAFALVVRFAAVVRFAVLVRPVAVVRAVAVARLVVVRFVIVVVRFAAAIPAPPACVTCDLRLPRRQQ